MTDRTTVYTDGACSGNPGPGGWAWVVPEGPYASGYEADTTNQRMELAAVLDALRSIDGPLTVVSDSTYVVNCFRDGWHHGWRRRGWKNSSGKPVANRVEGGKRPRSSMAPTIVLKDGAPVMALGSPGGSRIIGYVATALIALIDWGMSPAEAVAMGHVTASGRRVDLEEDTEAALLAGNMTAFGLEARVRNLNSGLAAMMIGDQLQGAADPRREGVVLGD